MLGKTLKTSRSETGIAAEPVPHAVFSLNGVRERDRYALWRESISCVFEVDAPPEIRGGDFEARVDANMFGPVMLARTETLRQNWKRGPAQIGRDGMDHFMVQLFERGTMCWDTHRGSFAFPEQGLVVFDLAREVASRCDAFSNMSLIIPRTMLEAQISSGDDQHMRVLTGSEPMVQLLRDHMLSLKRLSTRMSARQALEIAPATVGLTAACLNAAVSDERPDQREGVALAQMTVVRRLVECNLANPELDANWVARHANLSRSKLYELFEVFGGVANYIRERRLRRALLTLADRNTRRRSVYDVALEAGYSSDAAFARAFRNRFGIAPKEVRQYGVLDEFSRHGALESDRRYEHWLHHLGA